MACAVLQGHQVRVLADQMFIRFERGDGEHRLDEHNDQVHLGKTLGIRHGIGIVRPDAAVLLTDTDAGLFDLADARGIHIHQIYVVLL